MRRMIRAVVSVVLPVLSSLLVHGQTPASPEQPTLRISSRAVLVDVVVTDDKGKPVTGLKRDDFAVTEQGKPQVISFFEEHKAGQQPRPVQMPKLPPDVFSNFSPNPLPPAVDVLLLDSVNTRTEDQSYVHAQAMKFLKSAKPGLRMAIFTMGPELRFVQGFTDDPALLVAAMKNRKNSEVQSSSDMMKGKAESNSQETLLGQMQESGAPPAMTAALQQFFSEQENSQNFNRGFMTLANLQRLATFLTAYPGRKNVIWFTESLPAFFSIDSNSHELATMANNPGFDSEYKKTMNMLAAARVALYPVDARGAATVGFFQADNTLPTSSASTQIIGGGEPGSSGVGGATDPFSAIHDEDAKRNSDQLMQQNFAQDTGGKAFANSNDLSEIINKISSTSSDFYTLSYTPANLKMDGSFRKIEVKVDHGGCTLSYRRGYFATETDALNPAIAEHNKQIENVAGQNPVSVNPLLLFMDFGMPQAQQILFEARIQAASGNGLSPSPEGNSDRAKGNRYTVALAIDLKDLRLKVDPNGNHKGKLNISLIAYDRYGNIAGRNDQMITLDAKPEVYAVFEKYGVQISADIRVPKKGEFWLRAGVYDWASQRVGTMEIPLSSIISTDTSSK